MEQIERMRRMRDDGHSYRAIGAAFGVSHEYVRKLLGPGTGPERVIGLDGRNRPAKGNCQSFGGEIQENDGSSIGQVSTISGTRTERPGTRWTETCYGCHWQPPGPGGILCPDCRAEIEDRVYPAITKAPGDHPGADERATADYAASTDRTAADNSRPAAAS
jgi:hypothetical protein